MNYIWSKKSLLEFIENSINKIVKEKNYTFADLFAGTHAVGAYFKGKWHKVIANDLQYYSFVVGKNLINNNSKLSFKGLKKIWNQEKIINFLMNLEWKKWFIYSNYSLGWTKWKEFERMYFSDENAMKCDAIREKIEEWKENNYITEWEYFFLLNSLLEAIDKVANTASVYWAFLKKIKKSAEKPLTLKSIPFPINNYENEVFNEDINSFIKGHKFDVVYLDPPYNERQYSANYHLLETIAKYDIPTIKGKTWLRNYSKQKSLYSKKTEVKKIFADLIKNLDAKYIFLSYNDEWLMSLEEIKEIMSSRGKYWFFKQEYRRFKADKTENRNHKKHSVTEYLHYVKVKPKN